MAVKKIVYVTKANEHSPAFGITADTDEQVFISHAQAEAAELEVGDELVAVLKENDQPDRARWFAVAVKRVEAG